MLLRVFHYMDIPPFCFVFISALFPLLALLLHVFSFLFCGCANSMHPFNYCPYLIHLSDLFRVNITLLALYTLNCTVPSAFSLLALNSNFSHPTSYPCFPNAITLQQYHSICLPLLFYPHPLSFTSTCVVNLITWKMRGHELLLC